MNNSKVVSMAIIIGLENGKLHKVRMSEKQVNAMFKSLRKQFQKGVIDLYPEIISFERKKSDDEN